MSNLNCCIDRVTVDKKKVKLKDGYIKKDMESLILKLME